ncbi:MAG: hypothetical protein ACRC6V_06595 [Bacteroidales bacterium]
MAIVEFNELYVPVPKHLINRLRVFGDGSLSILGQRIVTKGTKMYFHVLNWEGIEVLIHLNVILTDFIEYLKTKVTNHWHLLQIRRIKYHHNKMKEA